MALYDTAANLAVQEPTGRPQEECAPVPGTIDGNTFAKQLFAFVTQTARGELAVVNLSAGTLIDQSRATPGVNFLPVGAQPTDVATTPDGKMAFVGLRRAQQGGDLRHPHAPLARRHRRAFPARPRADHHRFVAGVRASAEPGCARGGSASRRAGARGSRRRRGRRRW